jgi:hypothetical protein
MAETLYEGPAHSATFYVPSAGIVRFAFSAMGTGYVRSRYGDLLARVEPGARLFLSAGEHVLTLHDPRLMTRASIVFTPD